MPEKILRILTYEPVDDESMMGRKGGLARKIDYFNEDDRDDEETSKVPDERSKPPKNYLVRPHDIPVETLEKEMDSLVQVVNGFFQRSQARATAKDGMVLDEIELAIEINGEGKIGIIGNGAKVGAKGAIKLKFKRPD